MSKENKKRKISYETVMKLREQRFKKSQKPIIGIDIGSNFVKIVQLKNNKVANWGMDSIPDGMISNGRIEVSTQLAEVIKNTIQKNNIKGNECSLCLSCNELIVRELKLPEMSENQIMDNIKHEITSFLPLNHDEYCIDYKVLEYIPSQDNIPGKLRIMVAAVPNSIVNTYISTLKKANLKVTYVDVMPNIAGKLAKWIMINHGMERKAKNFCIVDFGAKTTNIIILKDGYYFIHKTITNGGDYLTQQIAEKLSVDFIEADIFKTKTNFFENNFQNNACIYVKNFVDYFLTDIERTIEFFNNRNNQDGVDQVYLMGGGSLLKGLPTYMKDHLSIEVSLISDALEQFKKGTDLGDKVAMFSQAIGATIREE